ncbi:MAG: CHAT domain-containing protein [Candidatus Scalindua sp.]|nr:CHAT domain-containing protein [Candidatus Scalindua sp.]
MRKYLLHTLIISIFPLVLFTGSLVSAQSHQLADEYRNKAEALEKQDKYLEAAKMYEKTVQAEKASSSPRMADLDTALGRAGYHYYTVGQYEKAIKYYEEALAIARKLGQEGSVATALNNIGEVYRSWGQYEKAIKYFEEALAIARKLGQEGSVATALNNIGEVYRSWGQYEKAIKYYEEALAIARKLGQEDSVATFLTNIGLVYNSWGQYDKAIKYYEEALVIDKRLGREGGVAIRLNNIGLVYKSWGQYEKAIKYYEEALAIARKLGQEDNVATFLNNIGGIYDSWGQYDKAIKYYEEALAIFRNQGREGDVATLLNNIGMVYNSWGQYDKAIKYFKEALVIDNRLGQEGGVATFLNNIGNVYDSWGQYDKAIKNYEEALAIVRKLGQEGRISICLNNIGQVYKSWGQYDKAIKKFEEALVIDKRLGQEDGVARELNNIGNVYDSWGQYDKAIKYYEEALAIARKLGQEDSVATFLNNIGYVYNSWGQYENAIKYFKESVSIIEKLRKTATGDVRMDYLVSQLDTYQSLTSAYIKDHDVSLAFQTIELSRAKLLTERLTGDESKIKLPEIEQIQETLGKDTAILVYANVDWEDIVQVVLTREEITGKEVSGKSFIQSSINKHDQQIKTLLKNQRVIKVSQDKNKEQTLFEKTETKNNFDNIVNYYRSLLKGERGLKKALRESFEIRKANTREIGRELYELLIKPMELQIKDMKNLIIVPDGILAFVPFETLIDEEGKYLVEDYHISYIQSIGIREFVSERKYSEERKPLLAFGGAVYDEVTYDVDMIRNDKQLALLTKNAYSDIKGNKSVRNAYGALGIGTWENLPGTLSEVNNIKGVVKKSDIFTGKNVTEREVKELSRNRTLSNYKVLHFATHGLVVPEMPELSAIVLSQFKSGQDDEDGYLRMGEIVELDIRADFVNLSACETGLGKIYGGEGVVGLTQSFLLAGANAVSVSLWSVADKSTSQYMVSMYDMVQNKNLSYADAMTEVKRQFINGDFGKKYKAPYYWAPFVYYGN